MASASEVRVEVVSNREIAPAYFSMRLAGPSYLSRFRPGQFLMLRWTEGLDPLLPRAMSIRRARKFQVPGSRFQVLELGTRDSELGTSIAEVEILYKVFGRGTALLAAMRPGRALRVLGLLGNGFEVPGRATEVLLVAGGVGAPPIAALAEMLAPRHTGRTRTRRVDVFLGGRSKADLLCATDFRRAGATLHLATEDGTAGHKGLVTDLLEQFLRTPHSKSPHPPFTKRGHGGISHPALRTALYACGPHPMLAALASIAEKYDLPYQASLEASMACGFGACMGCVVPVRGDGRDRTYRLVCKDGPIFDGRDIAWDAQRSRP